MSRPSATTAEKDEEPAPVVIAVHSGAQTLGTLASLFVELSFQLANHSTHDILAIDFGTLSQSLRSAFKLGAINPLVPLALVPSLKKKDGVRFSLSECPVLNAVDANAGRARKSGRLKSCIKKARPTDSGGGGGSSGRAAKHATDRGTRRLLSGEWRQCETEPFEVGTKTVWLLKNTTPAEFDSVSSVYQHARSSIIDMAKSKKCRIALLYVGESCYRWPLQSPLLAVSDYILPFFPAYDCLFGDLQTYVVRTVPRILACVALGSPKPRVLTGMCYGYSTYAHRAVDYIPPFVAKSIEKASQSTIWSNGAGQTSYMECHHSTTDRREPFAAFRPRCYAMDKEDPYLDQLVYPKGEQEQEGLEPVPQRAMMAELAAERMCDLAMTLCALPPPSPLKNESETTNFDEQAQQFLEKPNWRQLKRKALPFIDDDTETPSLEKEKEDESDAPPPASASASASASSSSEPAPSPQKKPRLSVAPNDKPKLSLLEYFAKKPP